jgi:uncharacterized repeat protein (TIGR01451 family)
MAQGRMMRAGLLTAAGAAIVFATGCSKTRSDSTTRPTTGAVARSAAAVPVVANTAGMVKGSMAYPTGDPKTSALVLEKAVPAEVIANKPYEYFLTVSNVSSSKLDNIVIHETIPAGLKLGDKLEGAALSLADGKAAINVGTLEAGASKTVKVPATATGTGAVTNCASVTYDSALCMNINVVAPALALTKTMPADVMVCDVIPLKFSLTNNGSGTARNVKLTDKLPEGMVTADGKSEIQMTLGDIPAGDSKAFDVNVKVSKTGEYTNTAVASADDGLKSEATSKLAAHQPVLVVEKVGPTKQYVGVPYTYDIKVTNKGDADAKELVVTDMLPNGLQATEASDGGRITANKVVWNVTNLAKGASKELKLTVKGTEMTVARNTVSAQAVCATAASVSAETQLVGIPAILLEVLDAPDPIAVGGQTTYTISVTNQGSAVATNVKLVSMLEEQMEYVSSKGDTGGKAEGKTISFEPLASLAPKAKATWTVVVKAIGEGDVRFKTTLTSDQLGRPVEELESTTFYK